VIDPEASVTGSAKDVPLWQALEHLLKPLGLVAVTPKRNRKLGLGNGDSRNNRDQPDLNEDIIVVIVAGADVVQVQDPGGLASFLDNRPIPTEAVVSIHEGLDRFAASAGFREHPGFIRPQINA
jgi:hypothetical protein